MEEMPIAFKAGTNLVEQVDPLFRYLYFRHFDLACNHCFRKDVCLRRCLGCKVFSYCGQRFQKADWKLAHKTECKVQQHIKGKIPDAHMNLINLAVRLFGFIQMQTENATQANVLYPGKTSALNNFADLGPLASASCPAEEINSLKVLAEALTATKCLTGPPNANLNHVLHYAGLAKLYISSMWYYCTPGPGDGFFPHYLLLQHSCRPNAVIHVLNQQLRLRAIKDISVGEEVTVNRMGEDYMLAQGLRNRHISRQLLGPCHCQRCCEEKNWTTLGTDLNMMKFTPIRNVHPDPGLFAQYTELKMQAFQWQLAEFDPAITLYLYGALLSISERLNKDEFGDIFQRVINHAKVSFGVNHPQFEPILRNLSALYDEYR